MGAAGSLLAANALRRSASAHQLTPSAHAGHEQTLPVATPSWRLWEPADLVEPEVRASAGGELNTELRSRTLGAMSAAIG